MQKDSDVRDVSDISSLLIQDISSSRHVAQEDMSMAGCSGAVSVGLSLTVQDFPTLYSERRLLFRSFQARLKRKIKKMAERLLYLHLRRINRFYHFSVSQQWNHTILRNMVTSLLLGNLRFYVAQRTRQWAVLFHVSFDCVKSGTVLMYLYFCKRFYLFLSPWLTFSMLTHY